MPLSAIVAGEFVALLMTVKLPVALTGAEGVKLTVKGRLCPAPSVTAPEKPLNAKAALETET